MDLFVTSMIWTKGPGEPSYKFKHCCKHQLFQVGFGRIHRGFMHGEYYPQLVTF